MFSIKKIDTFNPDLIAMTIFSYCYDYAENLIKDTKEYTTTDFGMKGESEASFVKFISELSDSKNYSKVGNLIWRDVNGNIVENEMEPLIKDVDTIPFPSFESFHFERYNYFITKTLPIITSRGYPYGCNFCSVKLSMGRDFRPRSPQNVIEEMKHWIKTYNII